jgi:hypothetical protein
MKSADKTLSALLDVLNTQFTVKMVVSTSSTTDNGLLTLRHRKLLSSIGREAAQRESENAESELLMVSRGLGSPLPSE